eukprot:m.20125 g.20125  ORF g.20125 m.20125 type:complete len:268 (-) comp6757_c0_seq2:153-956(-)
MAVVFVAFFGLLVLIQSTFVVSDNKQCGSTTTYCSASASCCAQQYSPTKYGCQLPGSTNCCKPGPPLPASTTKKNCLVIGDSVSIGYFPTVQNALKDVCQAQHGPWDVSDGGAASTSNGVACLDNWLVTQAQQPIKWDLITFNFGLHNLEDNTTAGLANYTSELLNITNRLINQGAKMLYVSTTPFMPLATTGDMVVEMLNEKAAGIMQEKNISVVDMYDVVTGHCGKIYKDCDICRMHPCSYHYNSEGEALEGNYLAKAMLQALQD